jgi:hypothetical protein
MIFGTAPLAYKGMNTKVHYYKRDKDPQIVVSKLFTLNNNNNNNNNINNNHHHHHHQQQQQQHQNDVTRRTSFSSINSDRSTASFNTSILTCEDNTSEQSSDDDHYSTSSIYPPILGLKSSLYTKRSRRFSQTNMENGIFSPTPLPSSRINAIGADANVRRYMFPLSLPFFPLIRLYLISLYDKHQDLLNMLSPLSSHWRIVIRL